MSNNADSVGAKPPLGSYARNVYSQFGDDGIIEEVIRRLDQAGLKDGWCVEFGAWDGVHLSNTCNLIRNHGYSAVLIEADRAKYQELCQNLPQENCIKLCRFVEFAGPSSLDSILSETPIPKNFDFLSIDIDGCDIHILDSLEVHRPKLICIEFNPTIPNEVEYVPPRDFGVKHGSSPKSILAVAERKGYRLVAATFANLFLMPAELVPVVIDEPVSLADVRDDAPYRTFVFFAMDGTLLSNRAEWDIQWHRVVRPVARMQILPKYLRVYPDDRSLMQRIAFTAWRVKDDPLRIARGLLRRVKGRFAR